MQVTNIVNLLLRIHSNLRDLLPLVPLYLINYLKITCLFFQFGIHSNYSRFWNMDKISLRDIIYVFLVAFVITKSLLLMEKNWIDIVKRITMPPKGRLIAQDHLEDLNQLVQDQVLGDQDLVLDPEIENIVDRQIIDVILRIVEDPLFDVPQVLY